MHLTPKGIGLDGSTTSIIEEQIRTFKIFFIFHFLIILNEDVSFFLAIQKQENKDFLINKTTRKWKIL